MHRKGQRRSANDVPTEVFAQHHHRPNGLVVGGVGRKVPDLQCARARENPIGARSVVSAIRLLRRVCHINWRLSELIAYDPSAEGPPWDYWRDRPSHAPSARPASARMDTCEPFSGQGKRQSHS